MKANVEQQCDRASKSLTKANVKILEEKKGEEKKSDPSEGIVEQRKALISKLMEEVKDLEKKVEKREKENKREWKNERGRQFGRKERKADSGPDYHLCFTESAATENFSRHQL